MPLPLRLYRLAVLILLALAACGGGTAADPFQTIDHPAAAAEDTPASNTSVADAGLQATVTAAPSTPTASGAAASISPETTAAASRSNTQYSLSATLDYARRYLAVEQSIQYTNNSPDALNDLLLMVEPAYFPGTFQLKALRWKDGQEVAGAAWEGTRLRLPLRQPLDPGEQITLSISYALNLPSPTPSPLTRPVVFGFTSRQINLVDWYPFIPPYIPGQGWLAHAQGYFGEHQVYEIADFQVELKLAEAAYGGQPLAVAASAPADQEAQVYRYHLEAARNFAFSISHDYRMLTEKVGPVTVIGYSFPIHASAGEAVLKATAQALDLYQKLYGPYPRNTLTVVEADFLDGREYDGLYFLSNGFYNLYQGDPAGYLTAIAVHETAHQWWYAQVGNDQALEPWLDEALCTYSEHVFFENVYPEALDWWWAYRVNYYQPQGWVDGNIYNPEGFRPYRDAVYLNGAVFLDELRKAVGDEAFFATLKDYAALYSQKLATGKDFFTVLAKHSSADISGLVKTYFQNNPMP